MATKELVTKVWIEEGCIVCDACETSAPTVFHVTDDTCVVRPEAQNPDFTRPLSTEIVDAAEECPVDVIKFDTETVEVEETTTEAPAPSKEPVGARAPSASEGLPYRAAAPAPATKPEPAKASAAESPQAPSVAPAEPAKAAAAKSPEKPTLAPVAGDPDPAIQSLLRAATQRGGMAAIARKRSGMPEPVRDWDKVPVGDLPPDARQVKLMKAEKKASKGVTRRGLMAGSAVGIGWLTFAGTGAVSVLAFQRFMMPNVLEEPDPKVRVGPPDVYASMEPGGVNEDFKPQGIWMIRTEDRVAALSIICTHLGCIPNWLPNEQKFKCPCHGSGFRPNGVNFEGPAPRPLERFKISVVEGIVVVDRSKKFQYEKGEWDNPDSYIAA